MRIALGVCLVASIGAHYAASPWNLFPQESLKINDLEGELTIPVDIEEGPATPPPPPPPAPTTPPPAATAKAEGPGHGFLDAGVKPRRDAGAPRDAGIADASGDAEVRDAGPSFDAAFFGDGAVPLAAGAGADAGTGSEAPFESAGPVLVDVLINVAVIRVNPVGAHLGPLLKAIPQWDEFMEGTDVDPIKDVEWIRIFGPGLIHTEKDAVLLRYNMTDSRAAKNIDVLSHKDANGGSWDAGVPGVKAWRGHADRAWRIFMLPRPHLAAMVPPEKANLVARAYVGREPHPPFHAGEAVRFTVQNASHALPQLPQGLGELRLWATPRADGGADAYAEIDAPDDAAADVAARRARDLFREQNSLAVKIVTRGLLDEVEVSTDGKMVKAHLPVSEEQLAALYDLIAAFLGVDVPPVASSLPPTPGASRASAAPRLPATPPR